MPAKREFFGGSTRADGLRGQWKEGGETVVDCAEVDRAAPQQSGGQLFTSPHKPLAAVGQGAWFPSWRKGKTELAGGVSTGGDGRLWQNRREQAAWRILTRTSCSRGGDRVAGLNKSVIQPAVTGHLAGVATCVVIRLLEPASWLESKVGAGYGGTRARSAYELGRGNVGVGHHEGTASRGRS